MSGGRRGWSGALTVLILAGLALRIWYAAEAPRIDRFVDEKYSLQNIRSIVSERTLAPASAYYPYPLFNVPAAALVGASEVLHRWTGNARFDALSNEGYGPSTFLLTRFLQSLYGALALLLTFLIGKRIFSRQAGLLAAAILAFMPWHIHASGYFKPDAQLVAMVLLAFYWSLGAVASPRWWTYLRAALGIALAMSTKMTGGLVAIPLVVGTLFTGWRDRRRISLLLLAGVSSAAIFVLLNPFWRQYPLWLGGLERDYAMRAARQGMTRWQVPSRVMELVVDPYALGAGLGALSLAAFLVLAFLLLRPADGNTLATAQRAMYLSFPIFYTLGYAWETAYFKDNNFLPLLPFFCLAVGWALVGLWRRAEGSWPPLSRGFARPVASTALLAMIMFPGWTYVYRATTPTTMDRALAFLARASRPPTGRLVLVEALPMPRPVWEGGRRFARGRSRVELVSDWQAIPQQRLYLADGTVSRPGSLPSGDLRQRPPASSRLFEPRWFRQRGPVLLATIHQWRRVGKRTALPIRRCRPYRRCREAVLPPESDQAEYLSLVVSLGFARGEAVDDVESIRVGDRRVPLLPASRTERGAVFVTEKFAPPVGAASVVLVARKELLRPRRFGIELHRWRQAEARLEGGR